MIVIEQSRGSACKKSKTKTLGRARQKERGTRKGPSSPARSRKSQANFLRNNQLIERSQPKPVTAR
jgi:hypothetical protein